MEIARMTEMLQEHICEVSREAGNVHEGKMPIGSREMDNKDPEKRERKPDIIIIDDDDDDDDDDEDEGKVENHHISNTIEICDDADYESDAGSRSSHNQYHEHLGADMDGHGGNRFSGCLDRRVRKGEKRPVQMVFNNVGTSLSASSDCEIIEDLDGKFRHEWEEAALRKQLQKAPCFPAESEESTTIINPPHSSSAVSKKRKECQYQDMCVSMPTPSDACQSSSSSQKGRDSMPLLFDQQDSNHVCSLSQSDGSLGLDVGLEASSSSLGNDTIGSINGGENNGQQLRLVATESNIDNPSKEVPIGNEWFFLGNELEKEQFTREQFPGKLFFESPAMKSYSTKRSEEFEHTQAEEVLWQDAQWQHKKQKVDDSHTFTQWQIEMKNVQL